MPTTCNVCEVGLHEFKPCAKHAPAPPRIDYYAYSYRPKGARQQRRWALATGNRPQDVVSTHASEKAADAAYRNLVKHPESTLTIEP